MLMRKLYTRIT